VLEDAGLISREDAPPPVATTLYALTSNGLALEPVLKALGTWGLRLMETDEILIVVSHGQPRVQRDERERRNRRQRGGAGAAPGWRGPR
jgi:DNA-binding HxlR family transcriptional regulator